MRKELCGKRIGNEGEDVSNLQIIWGADAIGRAINRSAKYVRQTLAAMPNTPVHRIGRRYWVYADELREFFDRLAGQKGSIKATSGHKKP